MSPSPSPSTPPRLDCSAGPYAAATEGRRLTTAEYGRAITTIFDGRVTASAQYPGAYGKSVTGYSTEPALSAVGDQSTEALMVAAEDVAIGVHDHLSQLLPCAASSPNDACVGRFIDKYIRRAYRRSVTAAERQRLLDTFHEAQADGANFSEAMALLTAYALEDPAFLYVIEDAAPTARALSQLELATRLAILVWDSIPDDALLDAAEQGTLVVADQLTRMLASPKADASVARFFREWTGTVPMTPGSKNLNLFPFLTDALASSLNASFDRYAADQLKNGGTIRTLLTSPSVFVDAASADFFGVPAPAAGVWSKVALDPTMASGIATQPALLSAMAHQESSSFILRGKLIYQRLLCQPLGDPPANAQSVFAGLQLPDHATGKEVSAMIVSNVGCAGCHLRLNPPGLAFETFDAVGHHQSAYSSGRPIDPTGSLILGSETLAFRDHVELMGIVAGRAEAGSCFNRQLYRFALSRPETTADGCALQAMDDALKANQGRLDAALRALVGTDAFAQKLDL